MAPIHLPEPTICDMNCFFLPDHKGPHQFDAERRMYCTKCDDYGHNAFTHKEIETKLKTIYLGGPMAGCTMEEMTGWREKLKKEWSEFSFRDPCDRTYSPQQWFQLVDDDIQDIDESDYVLCYMWKAGIGSSMELVEARYHHKPTIVVVPDFKYVSPWIRRYADFLVENFEHAYKIITQTWPAAGVEGVHHP